MRIRMCVKVKIETGSTFMFKCNTSCITSILLRKNYVTVEIYLERDAKWPFSSGATHHNLYKPVYHHHTPVTILPHKIRTVHHTLQHPYLLNYVPDSQKLSRLLAHEQQFLLNSVCSSISVTRKWKVLLNYMEPLNGVSRTTLFVFARGFNKNWSSQKVWKECIKKKVFLLPFF